jgi:hypothetical protein
MHTEALDQTRKRETDNHTECAGNGRVRTTEKGLRVVDKNSCGVCARIAAKKASKRAAEEGEQGEEQMIERRERRRTSARSLGFRVQWTNVRTKRERERERNNEE